MGSFAGMLKTAGYEVTGSDENVYPPMSDMLAAWGVQVLTPYAPAERSLPGEEHATHPAAAELLLDGVELAKRSFELFAQIHDVRSNQRWKGSGRTLSACGTIGQRAVRGALAWPPSTRES
jgi:hypothetical protein